MCSPCFRPTFFLFCASLSLLIHPLQSHSQEPTQPQLVRLSYVQGEVTFSPGKNGKPELGTEWLQASQGLTVEDGYTVATENGRAIVEFENGSLVYLAEHSVLQFQRLQLKSGVTSSRLQLLTGTATIAHVSDGHDQMAIDTPTAKLIERDTQTLRMDSTLNGTIVHAIDSLVPIDETEQNSKSQLKPGDGVAYIDGLRFLLKGAMGDPTPDPWDKWVNAQQVQRAEEIQKGLQESGLERPIPGLADLVRNGHFFDCPPYGKCWEPNSTRADIALATIQEPAAAAAQNPNLSSGPQNFVINRTLVGRCPMQSWMYSVGRPSRPGVLNINEPEEIFHASAFPWSSCFAGSWLVDSCWRSDGSTVSKGFPFFGVFVPWSAVNESCRGRMVYVVGHRHKHPPICRVHTPHGQGFVPQHPLDHHGQPPINAKAGVLILAFQKNNVEARFESGPAKAPLWGSDSPKPLDAPKNLTLTGAKPALPPVIEGHILQVPAGSAVAAKAIPGSLKEEISIHYDYKSKSFVAPHPLATSAEHNNVAGNSDGGPVVVARIGSHGASGGVTAHGSGSWSGPGNSGNGPSSSSSSEGSASHSGGSGSSSAGGGHSSGASSANSSSASSSGGGGASTSSSVSHH